ncbi:hypothetical protein V8C86DRAFT_2491965, partial [Haematococcus lacustris]
EWEEEKEEEEGEKVGEAEVFEKRQEEGGVCAREGVAKADDTEGKPRRVARVGVSIPTPIVGEGVRSPRAMAAGTAPGTLPALPGRGVCEAQVMRVADHLPTGLPLLAPVQHDHHQRVLLLRPDCCADPDTPSSPIVIPTSDMRLGNVLHAGGNTCGGERSEHSSMAVAAGAASGAAGVCWHVLHLHLPAAALPIGTVVRAVGVAVPSCMQGLGRVEAGLGAGEGVGWEAESAAPPPPQVHMAAAGRRRQGSRLLSTAYLGHLALSQRPVSPKHPAAKPQVCPPRVDNLIVRLPPALSRGALPTAKLPTSPTEPRLTAMSLAAEGCWEQVLVAPPAWQCDLVWEVAGDAAQFEKFHVFARDGSNISAWVWLGVACLHRFHVNAAMLAVAGLAPWDRTSSHPSTTAHGSEPGQRRHLSFMVQPVSVATGFVVREAGARVRSAFELS